jgi:putative SOS response-associated peptidase YedK
MCSNYLPARIDTLAKYFEIDQVDFSWQPECYPGQMAPILKAAAGGGVEALNACFGMVPYWADMKLARQTYNARSETVAEKPSFRNAWRKQQFCVVPLEAFFEPNYESGNAVRWQIAAADGHPLGLAGIWEFRKASFDGQGAVFSFSMLTINADGHPLMQRFHKPGDEKRMPVILHPDQYGLWLHADLAQAQALLQPWPAEALVAEAAPRILGRRSSDSAKRTPGVSAAATVIAESLDVSGDGEAPQLWLDL